LLLVVLYKRVCTLLERAFGIYPRRKPHRVCLGKQAGPIGDIVSVASFTLGSWWQSLQYSPSSRSCLRAHGSSNRLCCCVSSQQESLKSVWGFRFTVLVCVVAWRISVSSPARCTFFSYFHACQRTPDLRGGNSGRGGTKGLEALGTERRKLERVMTRRRKDIVAIQRSWGTKSQVMQPKRKTLTPFRAGLTTQ
jgi:hypothetical protein